MTSIKQVCQALNLFDKKWTETKKQSNEIAIKYALLCTGESIPGFQTWP